MDMFDPKGGGYAKDRYADPDAFDISVEIDSSGATLTAVPHTTKSPINLKSVYFFIDARMGAAAENGPKVKFGRLADGRVVLRISSAELQRYDGIVLWGDYAEPAKVIGSARSVEASRKYFFSEVRDKDPVLK